MHELITNWLTSQNVDSVYLHIVANVIGVIIVLTISSIAYYVARHQLLKVVNIVILKTKNTWDDALIEHDVLSRVTLVLPFILILFLSPLFLEQDSLALIILMTETIKYTFKNG
jgi:miniconductance mechanosensitive channel